MTWGLAIAAFLVLDLIVATAIIWIVVKVGWNPLTRIYPPREPSEESVTRRYQSFSFGLMNFGFALHVAADEEALHLTPARFLIGAGPISIPWPEIAVQKRSRNRRWVTARIHGMTVRGPAWCLDLADPDPEEERTS